jgi:hypothetical protein
LARRCLFFISLWFFVFQFDTVKSDTNLLPEHETSLYFNIGGSTSLEPTITQWGTGYSGGVGIGLGLSRIFSLVFDANYFYFPLDPAFKGPGKDMFHLIFLANGKFRFIPQDNPVIPYGTIGVGADYFDEAETKVNEPPYFNNFTVAGGNGFALAILGAIGMDIRLDSSKAIFLQYGITAIASKYYAGLSGFDLVTFKMGLKLNF